MLWSPVPLLSGGNCSYLHNLTQHYYYCLPMEAIHREPALRQKHSRQTGSLPFLKTGVCPGSRKGEEKKINHRATALVQCKHVPHFCFLIKYTKIPRRHGEGSGERAGAASFLIGSFHLWMEHIFFDKTLGFLRCEIGEGKYSLGPLIMLSYWVYKFDVKQAWLNGIYLFQKYHFCEALLHHPIDLGIFVIVLDAFMKGRLLTN